MTNQEHNGNRTCISMTDLSPAAAAVRAAYSEGCYLLMPHRKHQLDGMACPGLTSAIRAIADQVVPEEPEPDQSAMTFSDWNLKTESWDARMATRSAILAIAYELEAV
jgi:hypothetical protein